MLSGVDYNDIEAYLRSLNNLRLNLSDLIDQICTVETMLWMNKLERTELDINRTDTYHTPEVDITLRINLKEQVTYFIAVLFNFNLVNKCNNLF